MDKKRYVEDKPEDCAYCYFWNVKKSGCTKRECFYLLPVDEAAQKEGMAWEKDCGDCPYGRHSPCIGYCLKKIILEMAQKKQGSKKEGVHYAG